MEIPGYFYDEKKRRYFKITNGAVTANYHNSYVETEKRRRKIEQGQRRINQKVSDRLHTMGHKYHEFYHQMNFDNLRLGLVPAEASIIEWKRLQSLTKKSTLTYSGVECNIWTKVVINKNTYILLTNQDRNLQVLSVDAMMQDDAARRYDQEALVSTIDDNNNSRNRILELINRCNLLPFEYLTLSTLDNLVFVNLISESDLDNPELYQNICKIHLLHVNGNDSIIKIDKTFCLYSFINNLTAGEIKKDLYHLFGMNSIKLNQLEGTFEYDFNHLKSYKRFYITSSCFKHGYFILGTNLDVIYLIPIVFKHNLIKFSDAIIKFRFEKNFKLDKITNIQKEDQYLFLSSYKKIMIIDTFTNAKYVYSVDDLIKNTRIFKVMDQFKLVIVSFKKVTILSFSTVFHTFEVIGQYDLFNNNINQHSIITHDMNLVVNQSNHSLLILNLKTFSFHVVTLQEDQKINGFIRINHAHLLINFKNSDNTSSLTTFSI